MQMYTCTNASPARDGDLDNGVIVHEYGHGISIRQVGGPGNSSCLNNSQQAGEGWSDWLALAYTHEPGDAGTDARGIGTYLFGQAANGPGIRDQQYSTNPAVNTWTYESISGASIPPRRRLALGSGRLGSLLGTGRPARFRGRSAQLRHQRLQRGGQQARHVLHQRRSEEHRVLAHLRQQP